MRSRPEGGSNSIMRPVVLARIGGADLLGTLLTRFATGVARADEQARPQAGEYVDRETVEKMIREALQAQEEKNKTAKDRKPEEEKNETAKDEKSETEEKKRGEEKKAQEPSWLEVGKDLKLSTTWNNGLFAQTADQSYHVHVGGRCEFNNSWYTQDPNLLLGSSETTHLKDGSLFRRARLRADGRLWEFVDFVCEVNFANVQDASNVENQLVQIGSVGLTDFFVTFRGVPYLGNVRGGHPHAPVRPQP